MTGGSPTAPWPRPMGPRCSSWTRSCAEDGMTEALGTALRTYLDHLAVERGLAANTLASYRRDLRRYLGHLEAAGVDEPAEVTEAHVSSFLVALREGDE